MTVWDIDVAAAREVIAATAGSVADLQGPLKRLDLCVAGIAGAVRSAQVMESLTGFVDSALAPHTTGVVMGSGAALTATSDAVSYYYAGDQTMAETAARSAASMDSGR